MNKLKVEDIAAMIKANDFLKKEEEEKKFPRAILWALAIIGAIAAVAGIAYAVYLYFTPDYLEDFEDDFDDDFDDESDEMPEASYADVNYVDKVSCKEVIRYNEGTGKKKVLLVDCGVKHNIIRCLLKRDVEVIRVPWDYDYTGMEFDGLFISNGPGDPDTCDAAVQNIRKAMQNEKLPIFGICMGNQLLSKAGGAKIYKLKYGHRSHNQPVRMVGTERCFITSQNHGYAVDNNTLTEDWEPLFINMNDGSNEGIRHKCNPWFSAQFHPEAASGPTDTEFLFDDFVKLL